MNTPAIKAGVFLALGYTRKKRRPDMPKKIREEHRTDSVDPLRSGSVLLRLAEMVAAEIIRELEGGSRVAPSGTKLRLSPSKDLKMKKGPGLVLSSGSGEKQAFRHKGQLSARDLRRYLRKFADPERIVKRTHRHRGRKRSVRLAAASGRVSPTSMRAPASFGGGGGGYTGGGGGFSGGGGGGC